MPRGRPSPLPTTALGAAMQAKRAGASPAVAASQIGIGVQVYYRLERGSQPAGVQNGEKVAAWLGAPWTVGAVIDAARRPAE